MKRILALILVFSICVAAAQEATKITEGLQKLCSTTKSMLAASIMLFFIISVIPLALGGFLYFVKKENKNLKLAGIVLLVIGVLCLAGAALSLISYVLAPVYVSSMTGNAANVGC